MPNDRMVLSSSSSLTGNAGPPISDSREFRPKPVAVSPAVRRVTKTGLLPARRIGRYLAGPDDRLMALLLQDPGRHVSAEEIKAHPKK
jgi:hypothetical protein